MYFFLPVSPQQIDSAHDDTFTSRWLYFVCTLKCRHKLLPEGRTKLKSWEGKVVHFAWSSICGSESILHHSYPTSALGSWASWLLAHIGNTQSWQEIKGRNYIDVNIFISVFLSQGDISSVWVPHMHATTSFNTTFSVHISFQVMLATSSLYPFLPGIFRIPLLSDE